MEIDRDTIMWMALITLAIVGVWNAILSYKMWKAWNLKESGPVGKEEPETIAQPRQEAAPERVPPLL